MKTRCPKCELNTTQFKVYVRRNMRGKRSWEPVGWMCEDCGHLYKHAEQSPTWISRYGIPTVGDD